jgi:Pyruvate phosphate dikinase, PEP/pyruvate binding domain.
MVILSLTDEVLVQPMLKNVVMSGVAFSHDPATRSPYRLINWCSGPDTTLVTGGKGGNLFQIAAGAPVTQVPKFSKVLCLINELLSLYSDMPLDCEFAITEEENKSKLWLLQVRPLVLSFTPETDQEQWERLAAIRDQLRENFKPEPFLLGKTTIFGVMPDWNPAEIIGTRPRPLALSLYRELFTDVIWAYQRVNYGYRDLRSHCIMKIFSGLPYIDVRVSFNSFIPKDLDDRIGNVLVEYYLNELATNS